MTNLETWKEGRWQEIATDLTVEDAMVKAGQLGDGSYCWNLDDDRGYVAVIISVKDGKVYAA